MYMIDETAMTPQVWLLFDDQQGRDGIHMTIHFCILTSIIRKCAQYISVTRYHMFEC